MADARRTALHILTCVADDNKQLEHVYADSEHFNTLDARDQALVKQLVMTTLRRKGQADALIRSMLTSALPAKYLQVQWILRMGIVQLCWMRIPDHAAVSSSVDLAKHTGNQSHSGLVNALLNRVARSKETLTDQLDPRFILPLWLWRKLSEAYGEDKARKIAASFAHEPMLDITLHPDQQPQLASHLHALEATLLPQGTLRRHSAGANIPELPGFAEGHWWVQDAAASLPARLFPEIHGKTVIDACAAPGGKTMQLASAGAQVIALDISPARLARVYENIRRIRLSGVEVICEDALTWQPLAPVDAVLLDAPCSATGTLRRHPEGLWQKQESDTPRLAQLQSDLLHHAISWLKPEGTLIFVTCSLLPEEGEQQINTLLETHPDIALHPITQREATALGIPKGWVNKQGCLRIFPHYLEEQGGVDGFFIARLKKIAT